MIKDEIDNMVENIYLCGEHGRKDIADGYKTGLANLIADQLEKDFDDDGKEIPIRYGYCIDIRKFRRLIDELRGNNEPHKKTD